MHFDELYIANMKRQFDLTVTTDDIKYDHDAGHAYSYIDHEWIDKVNRLPPHLEDELMEYAYDWMYAHDDLPECEPRCECGR